MKKVKTHTAQKAALSGAAPRRTRPSGDGRLKASRNGKGPDGGTGFEQAFKNIDDVLRKEAGCTTELDYTEQTSWLLFLKYLDGLEQDRADEAALAGKKYIYILEEPYRWESWAAPKTPDGKLDHNNAIVGDDLRDFVNQKLFPYLHGFKERATGNKKQDSLEKKRSRSPMSSGS